jgi:DNA polymerase-3 subunit alpha
MAVLVLEDLSGQVDVVVFPDLFERQGQCLTEGAILDVRGRLDRRGEALQIVAESVSAELELDDPEETVVESVFIRFSSTVDQWADIKSMQEVDEILRRHEGVNPVVFEIPIARGMRRHLRSRTRRVEWSEKLVDEILAIPGVSAAMTLNPEQAQIAS